MQMTYYPLEKFRNITIFRSWKFEVWFLFLFKDFYSYTNSSFIVEKNIKNHINSYNSVLL